MLEVVEVENDVKTERITLNAVRITKSPESKMEIVVSPFNSGNYYVEESKKEDGCLINFDYWRSSKPKVVMSMDFAGIKIECLEHIVDGIRINS